MPFDDSDVKIFNDDKKSNDSFDEVSIISEMTKQRNNGNLDKSKALGKSLADIFANESALLEALEKEVGAIPRDDDTLYQTKVLLVFAAEYCLTHYLPSPLVASTAVNAMHTTVREKLSAFYDRLDDAAEYSFYYLAVRKGIHISANIGVSYAMLCGKEKDTFYEELGTKIFRITRSEIKKVIAEYEFTE